jgi:hypothetical protein
MHRSVIASLALPTLLLAGCGDSTTPNGKPVSIAFSSQALATAGPSLDVTIAVGTNTLVITKAQVVVRRIKLTTSTAVCADDDKGDDDSCAETVVGPLLVDLPLTSTSTSTAISADIPAGTYSSLEFTIHKPGGDTGDAAFATANPNFANSSIRIEGTFNGTPFVFTSTLSEKERVNFNPPVVIDGTNKNVTVALDVGSWFKNGSTVIDPSTANPGGANENVVRNNIRSSFRAFEDDDKNGH